MGRKFTIFALFYFVFESKFRVQALRGAYIRRGDLTEAFCVTILRGLYLEGLFFGGCVPLANPKFPPLSVTSNRDTLSYKHLNNIRYFLYTMITFSRFFVNLTCFPFYFCVTKNVTHDETRQ